MLEMNLLVKTSLYDQTFRRVVYKYMPQKMKDDIIERAGNGHCFDEEMELELFGFAEFIMRIIKTC